MERETIESIVKAGAASTGAKDRIAYIKVGDVNVPVILDADGDPVTRSEWQEYAERQQPPRRGKYRIHAFDSLLAWCHRFARNPETASAFVSLPRDASSPLSFTVIADDLPLPDVLGARRALCAVYELPYSDELRAWLNVKDLSVSAFDEFVDKYQDTLDTADVITAVRNIEVVASKSWKRTVNASGAVAVSSEEHTGAVKVPREFRFTVPVFAAPDTTAGAPMTFTARLICRIVNGVPAFTVDVPQLRAHTQAVAQTLFAELHAAVPHTYFGVAP